MAWKLFSYRDTADGNGHRRRGAIRDICGAGIIVKEGQGFGIRGSYDDGLYIVPDIVLGGALVCPEEEKSDKDNNRYRHHGICGEPLFCTIRL